MICSIPPLVGYAVMLTFSGYIMGIYYGFLLNYLASLLGAIIVFFGGRLLSRFWKIVKSDSVMVNRIEPHLSLNLLILLRLTPFPFSYSNLLFSALPIKFLWFLIPTALALLETIIHAYIGYSFREIVGIPILLNDGTVQWPGNLYEHPVSWVQIVLASIGVVALVVGGWKIFKIFEKIFDDSPAIEEIQLD